MAKKSIVIIPGLWEDLSSFSMIVEQLKRQGHHTAVVAHPSRGCEPPTKTMIDDVAAVHAVVSNFVNQGQEVVLVMHSAGGCIGSEGIKGLLAADRAKRDESGGVTNLVFITAGFLSLGEETKDMPFFEYRGDYMWCKNPEVALYNDLPEATAKYWTERLKHHPARGWHSAGTHEPWKHVPSTYLLCENDATLSLEDQKFFSGKLPGCEMEICSAGHCPFLSQPEKVVAVILKAAGKQSEVV